METSMEYIGKNDRLLEILWKEAYMPNSKVTGFNIHLKEYSLVIEVDIRLFGRKGDGEKKENLKLIFSGIKEYSFYHSSDYIFYNIEVYKLLKKGILFYISFDPYEGDLSEISEDDNDLILCESLEGYLY